MRILLTLTKKLDHRLVALERVDIAFRRRIDKFSVEFLPLQFVLREPLCPSLCVLSQP